MTLSLPLPWTMIRRCRQLGQAKFMVCSEMSICLEPKSLPHLGQKAFWVLSAISITSYFLAVCDSKRKKIFKSLWLIVIKVNTRQTLFIYSFLLWMKYVNNSPVFVTFVKTLISLNSKLQITCIALSHFTLITNLEKEICPSIILFSLQNFITLAPITFLDWPIILNHMKFKFLIFLHRPLNRNSSYHSSFRRVQH